jgi:uncharacterized DUF497 family protein
MHIHCRPRVEWDEFKRVHNLDHHGIDFAGLSGFFDGDLLTLEDAREPYGEPRFQSVGMLNGMALFVVWALRGAEADTPHIISARKSAKHETQAWLQRYSKC